MELILWRHAEAENSHPDIERVLTNKGREQAKAMAAWLQSRLPKDTRILVSPARRTQQTAEALGLDFSTLDALAPGASASGILAVAGWPHASGTVMIVGHQPTLGMAVAYAMTEKSQYWSIRKGSVWWLSHRTHNGDNATILRAVVTPDLL